MVVTTSSHRMDGSKLLQTVTKVSGPIILHSVVGASFSFMHVTDVNGDGRNDVITSNAHDYGIFWFEQGEGEKWTKRLVDDSWSQGHAVTLVDLNGDGKMDILTGKRFMAHNGKDPGEREPLGIYWYEQVTNAGQNRVGATCDRLWRTDGRRHADSRCRSGW